MALRSINEWMLSGESKGYITSSTIGFKALSPEDDGLFVRVNENGHLYGHRVQNQDIEMVASNTTDITVGSSETLLVELTISNDVTQANGSWAFTCKVNNGSGARDDTMTLILRDTDGNAIASKSFQIDKGDTGFGITMWGSFSRDWSSGSMFKVYATSGTDSKVTGTATPTTLKIVEAQAAPVTKVVRVDTDLGIDISRDEIEAAVGTDSQKSIIADNNGNAWLVEWVKELDKFAVTKLDLK